ncbi:MAG TPA: lysylphosphatidylglycerol synthase transmembrane domain-containing protein, partial [Pseudolabrys sp.]|nr:lysylphosphatidylglycerol synthase transmembrane domain-containing protein [Pseudolabrys sp.]
MIIKSAVSIVLLLGIIVFVTWNFGLAPTFGALQQLSLFTLGTAFVALLANAVAAALRFRTIAGDIGHTIGLRKALAAVSVGTLAGSAFFQLAGQLMARGVMMSRGGIPFASVVVMTLYERAVAAIISGLLALAGAYYIFGQIAVDQQTGGNNFIKIVIGLLAAATAGALLGYGRRAANAISPVMTGHFAVRLVRAIGLSLLVQLPMMAGYIIIAHALSPDVSLSELAAAASLVMFAASVPVSFAGWGIREMSAVFALGAIGVGAAKAVVTALLIGAGSLIAMAALAILSVTSWNQSAPTTAERTSPPIDYMKLLMWSLPVATAFLVLFQIYVPISSGTLLNVNLADPVVILGGSIFLLQSITQQSPPQWRIPHLNLAIGAMTVVLAISLIAGAARFGYTEWAVVNRFLGWFVLLAYAATGALVIKAAGREGFDTILLTFVAATAAIVAIEFAL